jgi:circadian clock protein KaiB
LTAKKDSSQEPAEDFEKASEEAHNGKYVLRLYVAGMSPRSVRAIENIRKMSEQYLKGRYELEVIDIYQQPQYAKKDQLLAAPTLIKKLPLPLRRLIGDMSDKDRILVGLDLVPENQPEKGEIDANKDES